MISKIEVVNSKNVLAIVRALQPNQINRLFQDFLKENMTV